jgi:hypothetical protein
MSNASVGTGYSAPAAPRTGPFRAGRRRATGDPVRDHGNRPWLGVAGGGAGRGTTASSASSISGPPDARPPLLPASPAVRAVRPPRHRRYPAGTARIEPSPSWIHRTRRPEG